MALQLNYDLSSGLTATNAYIRIESVSVEHNKIGNIMNIILAVYVSEQHFNDKKSPLDIIQVKRDYDPSYTFGLADNYNYLKTLPEYADAVDA